MKIFFILLSFPLSLLAQHKPKSVKISSPKILTDLDYNSMYSDSVEKHSVIDSLLNNKKQMQWETLLRWNGSSSVIVTRCLKRMQVACLNQPEYFYDSEQPIKLSIVLSLFNRISDRLVNKSFSEVISMYDNRYSKRLDLHDIKPFDTINYRESLFFLQNIPKHLKEGDTWVDSVNDVESKVINSYTVKSMLSKNRVVLQYKSTLITADNINNNADLNDHNVRGFIMSESSAFSSGYLTIATDTRFVYSMQGKVVRKMRFSINGVRKDGITMASEFELKNTVE